MSLLARILTVTVLIGVNAPVFGQGRIVTAPERGYVSGRWVDRWEEGLMSGNGNIGAMVHGYPLDETIVLSHGRLFLPWEKPLPPVDTGSHLTEIRRMLATGKWQDAADFVVELSKREGYGEKRWTDPLIPAFDLRCLTKAAGSVRNYGRSVNFENGEITVGWKDREGIFIRRLFVSRPDGMVAFSIKGPGPGKLGCRLWLAPRPSTPSSGEDGDYWKPGEKFREGIGQIAIAASGRWMTYRSSFKRAWPGSLHGYEGVAGVFTKGGSAQADGEDIVVKDADEALVLVKISLLRDFSKSEVETSKKTIEALAAQGYEALLAKHARVHGALFNRSRLDLDAGEERSLTSEQLVGKSHIGGMSKALLEKQYDMSRYVTISCTGDWPPSLQGVWNGTWGSPWSGDYTQNGNTVSAMSSMLSANMPQLLPVFFNYMDEFMPDFRENAKRLYNCRGIHVPSRMSTHGLNNHFDRWYPMTYWTAGAAFLARFYHEYWLYTGDRDFLAKRAVPFMKETALFYEDFLVIGPDGKYLFSPSYSPEDPATNTGSAATINATMDISLARELLTNLISACEELKIEDEGVRRWKGMIEKMPPYLLTPEGAVKEWATPQLEGLGSGWVCVALMDRIPADIAGDPKMLAAFKKTFRMLMDQRRRSVRDTALINIAFGQMATTIRDGKSAYEILDWSVNEYWTPSLTPTHNPRQLFNVDVCGGLPDLVIRMLVRSEPGQLELLPLLPEQWPRGRIEGVLCRGQIEIKSLEWDGKRIQVTLRSGRPQTLHIKAPGEIDRLSIKRSGRDMQVVPAKDAFDLELAAGTEAIVELVLK